MDQATNLWRQTHNFFTGFQAAWTGEFQSTILAQASGDVARLAGASPTTAKNIENTVDIGSGFLAGGVVATVKTVPRMGVREISEVAAKVDVVVIDSKSLDVTVFRSSSDPGEVYDLAKFAKVQAALEKEGVSFVTGEEGRRMANALGGEALYMPAEPGKPGIMVFGSNPTRAQVIEEVLHYGQHRKAGFGSIQDQIVELEIQAQNKLLELGARKNWTTSELEQIQRAKQQWIKMKVEGGL